MILKVKLIKSKMSKTCQRIKFIMNLSESRQIFLEEIMDWSDYFSDQFGESSKLVELNGEETPASKIFKSIVDLWLEFATFEISLRQFKVSN